jgi:hypothetical protein
MDNYMFNMSLSVDEQTGNLRAVYLRVRKGEVADTREVSEGRAVADYDAQGWLLGIELLAPCRVSVLDNISKDEPEPIRRFLRGAPPRDLVVN